VSLTTTGPFPGPHYHLRNSWPLMLILARWRAPLQFRRVVQALHNRCRSDEIFDDPRRNFLLDAWTLAELVRHHPVDEVRLTDQREQWPDGQVRIGQKIMNIEVTIALSPGRRLGEEYKAICARQRAVAYSRHRIRRRFVQRLRPKGGGPNRHHHDAPTLTGCDRRPRERVMPATTPADQFQ
jgi:hypothetical protein